MPATRLRMAPAERRRQIIDSARVLYADRSYDDVSTAHIAEAAGVARGLINYYFGDKRELFLEVMRESILMPSAKMVQGYEPIMPSFQGQISEEALQQLIAYIKSLPTADAAAAGTTPDSQGMTR